MDMRIFQVKSNKALPHTGSILIASPLLYVIILPVQSS